MTRGRRLTRPQRARANRAFLQAAKALDRSIGARRSHPPRMASLQDDGTIAYAVIGDRDVTYTLWLAVERKPSRDQDAGPGKGGAG